MGCKGGKGRAARIWADLPVVMKGSARQQDGEDGCDVAGQNEDEPKLDAEAVVTAEAVLDTRENCQFGQPIHLFRSGDKTDRQAQVEKEH